MAFNVVTHIEQCDKSNGWCNCFINDFIQRYNPTLSHPEVFKPLTFSDRSVIKSALDCEHNYKMAMLEGANKYTIHYLKSQFEDAVKVYHDLCVHDTWGVSKFLQTQIRNMYGKIDTKETCAVCCGEIEVEQLKTGKCGHMFHDECIKKWVISKKTPSCPTCCGEF
jgi:hypothetical protein